MKKIFIFLACIFLIGFFLRFYQLGEVPAGLHRDEAFLGYNAYSILKTGSDMSGNFLPLHFKSFLFSPAGYSYFSIPFIKLFDLTAFSVRFASAFFGSLTIILTFFLAKELFNQIKLTQMMKKVDNNFLALLSSLLIAISPWHINLSRTATENTIVVFFISLALFFFLFGLRKHLFIFFLCSFFSFSITLFLYQGPRAFLPFLIPLLIFFSKDYLKKREILIPISIFLFTIIFPLLIIFSSNDLSLRIKTVSIFSTDYTDLVNSEQIREDGVVGSTMILTRIFHNKLLGYSSYFFQNYFKHFSYDFLFNDQGYPDRYRVPHQGLIYLIELPFLLFGIICLLKKEKQIGLFLLAWLAVAPVGSALTFDDVPNLQRTLIIFPALSIVSAFGVYDALNLLKNRGYYKFGIILISVILIFSIFSYLHQYYIHVNVYRPWYRNGGYKELVQKINKVLLSYEKAVITNHESAPAIFFLFYTKYDPSLFQKETKNTKITDFDRIGFGKFEFSEEECPATEIKDQEKKLVVKTVKKGIVYVNGGLCKEVVGVKTISSVNRGDNSKVFNILSIN